MNNCPVSYVFDKTVLVVECKHDAVEPPVDEVAEQSQQLVQVAAGEQSAGESTIVAQLHHIEQAEAAHSSAVAASVEHTEQLVLVKRPPGELLAADTAQQATATIEVEQSRSVAQMPGLETASAASGDEGFKTVDSQLSVDHREWTTRLPARRCVVQCVHSAFCYDSTYEFTFPLVYIPTEITKLGGSRPKR